MPTTDLDNSAGWAGWLQSLLQNPGALAPYAPGATPTGAGPQGLMPGGGVMNYPAATQGQPSMGYPAVGQAAGRPSVAPGMQLPASAGNDGGFNNPYQAAAAASPPQGGPYVGSGPPGQGVTPTPMGQGGIGSDARFPIAGPLAAPTAGPMDPSIIARQKLMRPAATPAATSTAPPSAAQSPFTQVQRPNLPASGYRGSDQMMTALNLARLLGRA